MNIPIVNVVYKIHTQDTRIRTNGHNTRVYKTRYIRKTNHNKNYTQDTRKENK